MYSILYLSTFHSSTLNLCFAFRKEWKWSQISNKDPKKKTSVKLFEGPHGDIEDCEDQNEIIQRNEKEKRLRKREKETQNHKNGIYCTFIVSKFSVECSIHDIIEMDATKCFYIARSFRFSSNWIYLKMKLIYVWRSSVHTGAFS